MKNLYNIIFTVFITTICSCGQTDKHEIRPNQSETTSIDKPLVDTIVSTNYEEKSTSLDTFGILTHQRLDNLILDLEKTSLQTRNSKKDIPNFIFNFLSDLTTDSFSIADSTENWQGTDVIMEKNLPSRQLVYLGLGKDISLLAYYAGGIGKSEHILIIKHKNKKVVDFWYGNVLADLKNKKEIVEYLKTNKERKWGLNVGRIDI